MSKHGQRRIVALLSAAALIAMGLVGAGSVVAAQPGWSMTVVTLPSTVSPGRDAAYRVTIANSGPSNISQLYLTDSVTVAPSYLAGDRVELCDAQPSVLFCPFGALGAGASFTFTVGYTTPTTGDSFSVQFALNTTGASFYDKGKNSHGDTLMASATTALSGDVNFAGAFVIGSVPVENGSSLGRRNVQSTAVVNAPANVPVMVQDGSGVSFSCIGCTGSQFGEWSSVDVAEGATSGTPFKVVITVYSKSLPGKLKVNDVVVYHTYLDGSTIVTETIDQDCALLDGVATNAPCRSVQLLSSGNLEITIWVLHNGGFKGALG